MIVQGDIVHGLRAAAKLSGWSPSGLQKMVDVGRVRAEKEGRSYAFRVVDLEAIRRAQEPQQPDGLAAASHSATPSSAPRADVPLDDHSEVAALPSLTPALTNTPYDEGITASIIFGDLMAGRTVVEIVAERKIAPDAVQRHHQQWRELKAIDDAQMPTALERLAHVEAELALRAGQSEAQALDERLAAIESALYEMSTAAARSRQEIEARLRTLSSRSHGVGVPAAIYERLNVLEQQVRSLPAAPLLLPERRCGCGAPLAVLACCPACGAGRAAS